MNFGMQNEALTVELKKFVQSFLYHIISALHEDKKPTDGAASAEQTRT